MKYLLIIAVIYNIIWLTSEDVECPQIEFEGDYNIELTQDGYWISDKQGIKAFIELDSLESWFNMDNM